MKNGSFQHQYVAAIDFGTTYSGFAWLPATASGGYLKNDWPSAILGDYKTDTVVLYSEKGEFLDFGAAAREKFQNRKRKEAPVGLLELFKLDLLEHAEKGSEPIKEVEINGRKIKINLIEALAFLLEEMHKVFLAHYKSKYTNTELDPDKLIWVITGPGNANDEYFRYLRAAAYMAGITTTSPEEQFDDQLLTAKEPEVAALYCYKADKFPELKEKMGSTMVILDCGGGTVDIGAYQTVSQRPLSYDQIAFSRAANCGGSFLNKRFSNDLLAHVFATKGAVNKRPSKENLEKANVLLTHIKSTAPRAWQQLMKEWEIKKRQFYKDRSGVRQTTISIKWPLSILMSLNRDYPKLSEELEQNGGIDMGMYGEPDPWEIPEQLLEKKVFAPVVKETLDELGTVVKEVKRKLGRAKIDFLIIVGGYGDSEYLKFQIEKKFSTSFKSIISPPTPSIAVMEGAAFFGDDPTMVRARILSKSYGIRVVQPYDRLSEDRKYNIIYQRSEKKYYCSERLHLSRFKGEAYVKGERVLMGKYNAMDENTSKVVFEVFVSEVENAKYTRQQGVRPSVKVSVNYNAGRAPYSLYCYHEKTSLMVFEVRDAHDKLVGTSDGLHCDFTFGQVAAQEKKKKKEKVPPNVCYLLIDTSGSMVGEELKQAKENARSFLNIRNRKGSKTGIIRFDSRAEVIAAPYTSEKEKLQAIDQLDCSGTTKMDKALKLARKQLVEFGEEYQKSILLFTDGMPDDKEETLVEARRCESSGIDEIFCIGTDNADEDFLAELSLGSEIVIMENDPHLLSLAFSVAADTL